jgi:hypothetical protein
VADGEGPVASSGCNHIRSSKTVRPFEGADACGAKGFGWNEADGTFATLAVYVDALTLDVFEERPLLWPVDVPEAEIILVDAHLSAL